MSKGFFNLYYTRRKEGLSLSIKFGCHGSTWELDYDKETNYLDQLIEAVKKAGFEGIDVQVAMLGKYQQAPERLKEKLDQEGIKLAALTLPFTWENATESEAERERADYYISYLKNFPGAILNLPSRNGPNRENLLKRQMDIICCANAVGKRAAEQGVQASFHPASPETSYFRIKSDYDVLFENLDMKYIGYTPDAGHIAMGGMDPVEIVRDNIDIIPHVHFKDCSNNFEWKKMGNGDIDFPGIVQVLKDNSYNGWIMVEEETEEAAVNPDGVIMDINKYVVNNLKSNL